MWQYYVTSMAQNPGQVYQFPLCCVVHTTASTHTTSASSTPSKIVYHVPCIIMYHVSRTAPRKIASQVSACKLLSYIDTHRSVFNGDFTCCMRGHKLADGKEIPCDKTALEDVSSPVNPRPNPNPTSSNKPAKTPRFQF